MGDDTALPPLAGRARPLYSLLQAALRPGHEPADRPPARAARDVAAHAPRRPGAAARRGARGGARLELQSFFLYPDASSTTRLDPARRDLREPEGLEGALRRLAGEAEARRPRRAGRRCSSSPTRRRRRARADPALLAVGAVHHRLVAQRASARWRRSSSRPTRRARRTTSPACSATAPTPICPRLALETVAALAAADKLGGDRPSPAEAQARFRAAIEDGVLKVMSKMGISDVAGYRGAQIFDALGLAQEVVELCFAGTPSPRRRARLRRARARGARAARGRATPRRSSRTRATSSSARAASRTGPTPDVVDALHAMRCAAHRRSRKAVSGDGTGRSTTRFAALVDGRAADRAARPARARARPSRSSARRGRAGRGDRRAASRAAAMSHGALSAEAHETIAIALNRLGARSNCGEGGEDPDALPHRAELADQADRLRAASASRPSTPPSPTSSRSRSRRARSRARAASSPATRSRPRSRACATRSPGVALISPPPHHDIYSIEDLAQLDLRPAAGQPGRRTSR